MGDARAVLLALFAHGLPFGLSLGASSAGAAGGADQHAYWLAMGMLQLSQALLIGAGGLVLFHLSRLPGDLLGGRWRRLLGRLAQAVCLAAVATLSAAGLALGARTLDMLQTPATAQVTQAAPPSPAAPNPGAPPATPATGTTTTAVSAVSAAPGAVVSAPRS